MVIIRYGMEGYAVKLLQYALKRAGLDVGDPDGIFGRRTMRALQRFQREQGLSADGIAGKLTWAALYPYITGYTLHREGTKGTMTVPLDLTVVTDALPCSYLLTGLMLKGLAVRYPFIQVKEIGRSVMGRPILDVSMGNGPLQVGYVGPHHADKGSIVMGMFRFLEEYASACSTNEISAKKLYDAITLHIVPLVNPDGVDLVSGALDPMDSFYIQAQALAAHFPDIPFPEGWVSNISGVDLSLQYPAGWEETRRVRFAQGFTRPGPQGYVGSEPLIAPECRTLAKWTKRLNFVLLLSFDAGYTDWSTGSRNCRGITLNGGDEDIQPILAQYIPASP